MNPLDEVGAVADAVLFEGYLLYPYRASAQKNRLRWQFGVLTPSSDGTEPTRSRTEVLLEPKPDCRLRIRLRFRFQISDRKIQRRSFAPIDTDWSIADLSQQRQLLCHVNCFRTTVMNLSRAEQHWSIS